MANASNPLLLLDNENLISVVSQGEFKSSNMSFEEAKAILDMHDESEIVRCFTNNDIENIIFNYLGIAKRNFSQRTIGQMKAGQDAIVFKIYVTPSETQPIIETEDGIEAKKIQNVYVYCQYLVREK